MRNGPFTVNRPLPGGAGRQTVNVETRRRRVSVIRHVVPATERQRRRFVMRHPTWSDLVRSIGNASFGAEVVVARRIVGQLVHDRRVEVFDFSQAEIVTRRSCQTGTRVEFAQVP